VAESSTPQPLLRPLLERLTDLEPTLQSENADRRSLSERDLRKAVIRDLGWLLDTTRLGVSVDLVPWPEVECSVLNFGLPSFTGETASSLDVGKLEKAIHQAICRFEPRILEPSLKVAAKTTTDGPLDLQNNVLRIAIVAQVFAQPVPIEIDLSTEINLETGQVVLQERRD